MWAPSVGTLVWTSGQGTSTAHTRVGQRAEERASCPGVCSTRAAQCRGPVPASGCRERRKRTDRWAVWAVEERASSEAERECPVYF